MEAQNGTGTPAAATQAPATTAPTAAPVNPGAGEGAAKEVKSQSKEARTKRALAKIAQAHVPKEEAKAAPAAETAKVEVAAPVVEPKKEAAPEPKVSKRLTELKAREVATAKRESDLAAREAALVARESTVRGLKEDPIAAMEAAGMTFTDLADAVIADAKVPESVKKAMKAQRDEIKLVKDQIESDRKKKTDAEVVAQDKYVETTISTYKTNLNAFIEKNSDKYELVNLNQGQALVWDIIETYSKEHGTLPEREWACEAAEKFFEDRYTKMQAAKKFKPKEVPVEPAPEKKPTITLSNAMANGSPRKSDKTVPMSDIERKALIAKKIRWDS